MVVRFLNRYIPISCEKIRYAYPLLESRKRDENSERPWDVTQTLKQTKDNAIVVIVIT